MNTHERNERLARVYREREGMIPAFRPKVESVTPKPANDGERLAMDARGEVATEASVDEITTKEHLCADRTTPLTLCGRYHYNPPFIPDWRVGDYCPECIAEAHRRGMG